jgi:hypothetical protein
MIKKNETKKQTSAPALLPINRAGNKAMPELVPSGELASASAEEFLDRPYRKLQYTVNQVS